MWNINSMIILLYGTADFKIGVLEPTWALRRRDISAASWWQKLEIFKAWEECDALLLVWWWRGSCEKECGALRNWGRPIDSSCTTLRNWLLPTAQMNLETDSSPGLPGKNPVGWHFDFGLMRPPVRESSQAHPPQCEVINGCYFKIQFFL